MNEIAIAKIGAMLEASTKDEQIEELNYQVQRTADFHEWLIDVKFDDGKNHEISEQYFIDFSESGGASEAYYCAILLTNELFIKLGFDEFPPGWFKTRNSLNKKGWSDKFTYYLPYYHFSAYVSNIEIKHVHQLQNLYTSH